MKLLLGRHQRSIGNLGDIIQGHLHVDVGLSEQGRTDASRLISQYSVKGKIDRIISSPWRRCVETATIYNASLNLPLERDNALTEFNPGILSDLSKADAKKIYPNYYQIYMGRGDLDKIPGADTGRKLQARALYFMERYSEESVNDLIVTHGGFVRYLYNTIMNFRRTTILNVEHEKLHAIEFNPWERLDKTFLLLSTSSTVYKIKTADEDYVLKKVHPAEPQKLAFQEAISQAVSEKEPGLVAEILYSGVRDNTGIQVLSYLPGEHYFGSLTTHQTTRLIKATHRLSKTLASLTTSQKPSFKDRLLFAVEGDHHSDTLKQMGSAFFANERARKFWESNQVVVNYDIHRHNILFNGDKVHFLDLDGYAYGNRVLQPACLLTNFLLESETGFDLSNFLSVWPEQVDVPDCIFAIKARLFMGIVYFTQREKEGVASVLDQEILSKYSIAMNVVVGWDNGFRF